MNTLTVARKRLADVEEAILGNEIDIRFITRKIAKMTLNGGKQDVIINLKKECIRYEELNQNYIDNVIPFLKEVIEEEEKKGDNA